MMPGEDEWQEHESAEQSFAREAGAIQCEGREEAEREGEDDAGCGDDKAV